MWIINNVINRHIYLPGYLINNIDFFYMYVNILFY